MNVNEENLKFFKDYGFHYDPENGILYSHKDKIVKGEYCKINKPSDNILVQVNKGRLCWYLYYNEISNCIIKFKDSDSNNYRIDNLYEHEILYGDRKRQYHLE